ncbi:glycosyltransferase family 4 protein [Chryseobacterium limigenitum]|uniref:Glycosyltransferase involved in cell wall bisynthesis n=2 Tax=Chryseobacterium limigenitum TaxID=1612149 RepID=A0A1K2IIQ0_9FLAO|nr:glycosyltransferase family 4 protein [Chryseobacterium limigenitum]SFZ92154.1 Glycosyltransferase involved in cell wall bisynthesis [Chryseobacterium limigenitum]
MDGQSKASKVLLEALIHDHEVSVINLSKSRLQKNTSLFRFFEIFRILLSVWKERKDKDIIYLSLAESFLGNMRDIAIYILCRKYLNKTYIHMLGGEGMKNILSKDGWQKHFNVKFMTKLAGVFVEGSMNYNVFMQAIAEEKIHIVPNFAEDFLFVEDDEIKRKFNNIKPINILYLSNLIFGKGYDELVDAYLSLSKVDQKEININFVGGFDNKENKNDFFEKIKDNHNLNYLGEFVDGEEKKKIYAMSHVFCLPTYYPFEGQPISILESYASGCVVVTTDHSGIPFIFKNIENGFLVEKKSILSLKNAVKQIISNKDNLSQVAIHNKDEALKKYRRSIYQEKILQVLLK